MTSGFPVRPFLTLKIIKYDFGVHAGDTVIVEEGGEVSIDLIDSGLVKMNQKIKFTIPLGLYKEEDNVDTKPGLFIAYWWCRSRQGEYMGGGRYAGENVPTITAGVRG